MSRSPRHLRPPIASPVGTELWPGIETEAEAEARNEDRADALWSRVPEVARKLARCDGDVWACRLPVCAICSRQFRIDVFGQLRRLATSHKGTHEIATIYFDEFPPGELHRADLQRAHDLLRQRFNRAGLRGATLTRRADRRSSGAPKSLGRRGIGAGCCMFICWQFVSPRPIGAAWTRCGRRAERPTRS
jgi:hypothetical protein